MKRILVACDHSRMDAPLRRSLAHLVKSCDISVAHDGHSAFEEISLQPFDLIIIDFALGGIDSLELVESIQYIDPGVPVILLVQPAHKAIKTAAFLKAQPIMCPFKPLKFLRLVDKLLHQQLNRYRQLANTLETALETLRQQTNTPGVFLIEDNGQVLLSKGDLGEILLEALGNLAVGLTVLDEELNKLFVQDKVLHNHYQQAPKDHGLYVTPVSGNLHLALLSPLTPLAPTADAIWPWLDKAAINIHLAFDRYNQAITGEGPDESAKYQIKPQEHLFIPLSLESTLSEASAAPVRAEISDDSEDEEEIAVNWQIITNASNLLARLQSLSQNE